MPPSPHKSEADREGSAIPSSDTSPEEEMATSGPDKESGKDLYTALLTEAPYMRGDASDLVSIDEIPWVDKSLIEHSISFHRKYFTFVIVSNTFALMYGFAAKLNSAVLLRTGKLHDPELSFQRYLSTIQRIGKFFMLTFDQVKAYKALATVRRMHLLASKKLPKLNLPGKDLKVDEAWKTELALAMRNDLDYIDTSSAPHQILTWDPPVPVSQFDMAITQFGFVGTMWLFPRVFGIQDRAEEMKGVIHTWAIFGRLLGIKDEYNVCIHPDPVLFDKLFLNVVLQSLKSMDETVITIQRAFMDAFSKRVPFMTYKAMLFFGLQEVEGYKGEHLWKLMSWWDKLSLYTIRVWFWGIRSSSLYRIFMHFVTGCWLQFHFWLHLTTSLWD